MEIKPWKLNKAARCAHCKDATIHSIIIDRYKMKIKCRDCGFTRFYNFHVVNIPKRR